MLMQEGGNACLKSVLLSSTIIEAGGGRVKNLQKIKQMNIDELAVFLFGGRCSRCAYFGNICNGSFFNETSCTTGIKKFLAEEAL